MAEFVPSSVCSDPVSPENTPALKSTLSDNRDPPGFCCVVFPGPIMSVTYTFNLTLYVHLKCVSKH